VRLLLERDRTVRFNFSDSFFIDSDEQPWRREGLRVAMLGGPGSGKSWNNSLIAEQFLSQGGTVVAFQPRDEYFTLKEKFDILSVGGVHAKDMEFALTSPSVYAKAVVQDGISMIFYTSDAEEEKLIDWVSRFIQQILSLEERHKRPLLLILEEAHEYTPKSPSGHIAPPWIYNRMIKAFKDCFSQGRKLNIIAVASSQRPQELNFTVRQLANLTFYGKFSDQDIGYIDNECLKYIRKQGIEIDASRLVSLGLGEWLVIMGRQTRFVKVTYPRLTKHGAETPRLEYVAPRTTEVKSTIDQLTKAITEALQKDESEQSEVEKLKRKLGEATKKLEEAEEKAKIKLSVKEMFQRESTSKETPNLKAKIEELTKVYDDRIGSLEVDSKAKTDRILALESEKQILDGKLKAYESLDKALAQIISLHIAVSVPPSAMQGGSPSEIIVSTEQPALTLERHTPPMRLNDSTLEGKIAIVYAEGKLPRDKWFRVTDVTKAFESHGWSKDPRTSTVLDKFCQWGYFEKQMSGRRPDYRLRMGVEEAKSRGLLKTEEKQVES